MLELQIILVLCSVTHISGSCINSITDPCLSTVYTALNQHTRSVAFYNSSAPTERDSSILEGWYRSTSPAGGDMPTSPPSHGYCQALYPVWLQGSLPSIADGIVSRTACVNGFSNTCSQTISICVKNCVSYNVYHLYRPSGVNERYCFGTELPCPSGYGSSNGFTPGCQEINVLVENPSISHKVEEVKSISTCLGITTFSCNILHNITSVYLEVVWSVGGNIMKTENVAYTQLPAKITSVEIETQGVTGNGVTLKCQMKARETPNSVLGNAMSAEITASMENGCQSHRNSTCWDCVPIKGCTKKPQTCQISNVCYNDGMENPMNSEEICSSGDDEDHWTPKSGSSLALKIGLGVTGGILCLVLVILGIVVYTGKRSEKGRVQSSMVNISQPGVRPTQSPPPMYCEVDPYSEDTHKRRVPTPVEDTGYKRNMFV